MLQLLVEQYPATTLILPPTTEALGPHNLSGRDAREVHDVAPGRRDRTVSVWQDVEVHPPATMNSCKDIDCLFEN